MNATDEFLALLPIDLQDDPIEKLHRYALLKAEMMYQSMKDEKDMCLSFGVSGAVIARYGFRGSNREAILEQLKSLIEHLKIIPYGEADREELISQARRHGIYNAQNCIHNPYLLRRHQLWGEYVRNLVDGKELIPYAEVEKKTKELEKEFWRNRQLVHRSKECHCFNNFDYPKS